MGDKKYAVKLIPTTATRERKNNRFLFQKAIIENDKKIIKKANCPDLPFSAYRFVKNKIEINTRAIFKVFWEELL